MSRMILIAAVLLGSTVSARTQAGDESELQVLLKTFVDELVPITPGEGKFPAELVAPFSGDVVDGQARKFPLKQSFSMAKYEVPQNLYTAVMGTNPSKWTGPRNSAEMMTWTEAREFCRKLTLLLQESKLIEATEEVRLPTEVEWEYCCRAGTDTAYSFGDRAQAAGDEGKAARLLDEYGWHTGNAAGNDPPVGALKPNPWGLYDVHGYLWEYCSDAWSAEPGGAREIELGSDRVVIRGGSWKDRHEQLTSASRRAIRTEERDDAVGFRCVLAGRQ